jgi:hypothetical protein
MVSIFSITLSLTEDKSTTAFDLCWASARFCVCAVCETSADSATCHRPKGRPSFDSLLLAVGVFHTCKHKNTSRPTSRRCWSVCCTIVAPNYVIDGSPECVWGQWYTLFDMNTLKKIFKKLLIKLKI